MQEPFDPSTETSKDCIFLFYCTQLSVVFYNKDLQLICYSSIDTKMDQLNSTRLAWYWRIVIVCSFRGDYREEKSG